MDHGLVGFLEALHKRKREKLHSYQYNPLRNGIKQDDFNNNVEKGYLFIYYFKKESTWL
jgi:hypothetical protein